MIMKNKLILLKEYVQRQADDDWLWPEYPMQQTYAQGELKRVAWLIESATQEQIENEIAHYDERHM